MMCFENGVYCFLFQKEVGFLIMEVEQCLINFWNVIVVLQNGCSQDLSSQLWKVGSSLQVKYSWILSNFCISPSSMKAVLHTNLSCTREY